MATPVEQSAPPTRLQTPGASESTTQDRPTVTAGTR